MVRGCIGRIIFNRMKPYALFIGRWQPFHYGHHWLISQKLGVGVPCLIAVRDILPDEKNPFTTEQTVIMIRSVFEKMPVGMVQVIVIPNIESVNYGRGVGYAIVEHTPPENVKVISATKIRNSIKLGET